MGGDVPSTPERLSGSVLLVISVAVTAYKTLAVNTDAQAVHAVLPALCAVQLVECTADRDRWTVL